MSEAPILSLTVGNGAQFSFGFHADGHVVFTFSEEPGARGQAKLSATTVMILNDMKFLKSLVDRATSHARDQEIQNRSKDHD